MIGPWLQFRDDPEIGAEETCPDVRTKLFARAIRAILVIAAQIPVQPVACANPVGDLMSEDGVITLGIPERLETRHLNAIAGWLIEGL